MLLFFVILTAAAALIIGSRFRLPDGVSHTKLGWMSERWLADYRASHGS